MIIETGYDLTLLLFGKPSRPGALMMLAMGDDLRAHWVRPIVESFDGTLGSAVLGGIDRELGANDAPGDDDDEPALWQPVRFAALGYWVPDAKPHLERKGVTLLGLQAYDGEFWATTGPASVLASYVMIGDDIPRVIVIPGPHPGATCECAVCGPRRAQRQQARAMNVQDSVQ